MIACRIKKANPMRYMLWALFILCAPVRADDASTRESAHALAVQFKMAGTCQEFDRAGRYAFQDKSGRINRFIERFEATEAARLGNTVNEYRLLCGAARNQYLNYVELKNANQKALAELIRFRDLGECGWWTMATQFQVSTKMEAGEEFLNRFVGDKAKANEQTPGQLLEQCKKNEQLYKSIFPD